MRIFRQMPLRGTVAVAIAYLLALQVLLAPLAAAAQVIPFDNAVICSSHSPADAGPAHPAGAPPHQDCCLSAFCGTSLALICEAAEIAPLAAVESACAIRSLPARVLAAAKRQSHTPRAPPLRA